jgi:hypothetical protein
MSAGILARKMADDSNEAVEWIQSRAGEQANCKQFVIKKNATHAIQAGNSLQLLFLVPPYPPHYNYV